MMPWIVATLLFASVCSAAMGMSWLIGVRRPWILCLVSISCGAGGGALLSAAGAMTTAVDPTAAIWRGAVTGGAIGTGVWALLWFASRSGR